jgi:parallel beta-helix repeat protein
MNLRRLSTLLAVAVFVIATAANAAVINVEPGDDLQAAIDSASPGDTILVEPGVYTGTDPDFGLRIITDNLRLIGKVDEQKKEAGKIRLVPTGSQRTGIYVAPDGCEPRDATCPTELVGFELRGFSVEDFPRNGIQTRFVRDFQIVQNESARNLNNGIYPTISVNGLVADNVSYGSLDTAAWVAGGGDVVVMNNEFYDSTIGFEITVSNNVTVTQNDIHDNTVGVAMIHPNGTPTPQQPVMANWVISQNDVYDNNLPNPAPPISFQGGLPSGLGILLLGVSDHEISQNTVDNNDFVGIGVLGWCTATGTNPLRNCIQDPPQADPAANNNLVSQNTVKRNGLNPPTDPPFDVISFLAADITYFELFEESSGNCFEKNQKENFTFVTSELDELLPDDGC